MSATSGQPLTVLRSRRSTTGRSCKPWTRTAPGATHGAAARIRGNPAQPDCEHPGGDQHQRYRRDLHAEQIDPFESHDRAPVSNQAPCFVSASTRTRMPGPRQQDGCGFRVIGGIGGEDIVEPGQLSDRRRAVALRQRRQRASSFGPRSRSCALRCRPMISLPTESAATSCSRCSGVASSGTARSRPCIWPCQSGWLRPIARRRRSRRVSASSRHARKAGDNGGSSRNDSAAKAKPKTMTEPAL